MTNTITRGEETSGMHFMGKSNIRNGVGVGVGGDVNTNANGNGNGGMNK